MSDPIRFEREGFVRLLQVETADLVTPPRYATEADLRAAGFVRASELADLQRDYGLAREGWSEAETERDAALARVTELEWEIETTVSLDTAHAELDEQRAGFEAKLRELAVERDALNEVVALLMCRSCSDCGEYAFKCVCGLSPLDRARAKLDALRSTKDSPAEGAVKLQRELADSFHIGQVVRWRTENYVDLTARVVSKTLVTAQLKPVDLQGEQWEYTAALSNLTPVKDPRAAGEEKPDRCPSCRSWDRRFDLTASADIRCQDDWHENPTPATPAESGGEACGIRVSNTAWCKQTAGHVGPCVDPAAKPPAEAPITRAELRRVIEAGASPAYAETALEAMLRALK